MNIQFFCTRSVALFNEKLVPLLTAQQKKTILLASMIFAVLLIAIYVFRNWTDNKVVYFNGHGHLIAQNGDVMNGDFKDGMLDGLGKVTRQNGEIWEGEFKCHKLNGQGKKTYSDGRIEEGLFKEGVLVKGG